MTRLRMAALLALLTVSPSFAKTTLTVESVPPGATFHCATLAKAGRTPATLEIPKTAFGRGTTLTEQISFEMEGHWPTNTVVNIRRGKKNSTRAVLEAVDTQLTITSTPPGAQVELSAPLLGTQEFTTPYTFEMPASFAATLSGNLVIARVSLEGYLADSAWVGRPLDVPAGQATTHNIPMQPILTTLQVLTEPEGADVEDIEPSGFGYLGTTPLIRRFTFDDLKKWADKQRVVKFQGQEPELADPAGFDAIELTLRITKAGYEDSFLRTIRIPVGEERSFHRTLNARARALRFLSDPEGAHVFVVRFTEKDIFDEPTGQLRRERVTEEKYLGTTPVTYNMDPSDPLVHGERLIFRKSGFKDQVIRFSVGETTYFVVM